MSMLEITEREITFSQAINEALAEEMRRDETVFVIGEEVAEYEGAYKVTQGLLDEFGAKRVIDTPIVEHGIAGLGVGMESPAVPIMIISGSIMGHIILQGFME